MSTSPTWMLPFTLRVMMRPLSRPSRTRTLTWTASPVIPSGRRPRRPPRECCHRPPCSLTRVSEDSSLLHRADLRGDVVDDGLRFARVEDRDRGGRLAQAHRDAELLLTRHVGVRHALLFAEERHVREDLLRLDVLRHHDELRLASLDELRDLVRPFADFPALLRELDRLIRLVDELFRHLEANVHWLGHRGDLLPPRGRGTSSVIGSPSSEKRPSKWRGL